MAAAGEIQRNACAGLGLPAGATVADLVAALAARGRVDLVRAGSSTSDRRSTGELSSSAATRTRTGDGSDVRAVTHRPRSGSNVVPRPARPPAPREPASIRVPQPRGRLHPTSRPGTAVPLDRPRRPAAARPRIEEEPVILGLARFSRGRVGSRLFTLFFVLVFGLIFGQMLVALLVPCCSLR